MKKIVLGVLISLMLIVVAFLVGRWTQDAKNGYHNEVLEEKEIASALGPIHWKTVSEYVGFPFIQPETTMIEVDGRLIYKAQRIFQESYPVARNVTVSDDLIVWDDGQYAYSLKMQKIQPADSGARHGAAGSAAPQPNQTPRSPG